MKIVERLQDVDQRFDSSIISWMARRSVLFTRIALGLVFLWFGSMKFFFPQGQSEQLAARTIAKLTAGIVTGAVSLPILAAWECTIAIGLLTGKFLRTTILLLLLQMPGTFAPLFLFPGEAWVHAPYEPTLVGQYILKNIVLLCAALLVGGTMCGGKVAANPKVESDTANAPD